MHIYITRYAVPLLMKKNIEKEIVEKFIYDVDYYIIY